MLQTFLKYLGELDCDFVSKCYRKLQGTSRTSELPCGVIRWSVIFSFRTAKCQELQAFLGSSDSLWTRSFFRQLPAPGKRPDCWVLKPCWEEAEAGPLCSANPCLVCFQSGFHHCPPHSQAFLFTLSFLGALVLLFPLLEILFPQVSHGCFLIVQFLVQMSPP